MFFHIALKGPYFLLSVTAETMVIPVHCISTTKKVVGVDLAKFIHSVP